jgi:periplasmic divalent cation tolerance protein
MTERICEVIITADDEKWLADLSRALVEERLVACGQLINTVSSTYRWAGEVQTEREARVALHTREALLPALIDRVRAEHTYEVPCVIALPIILGNPDYVEWVLASTAEPGELSGVGRATP